MNYTKVYEYNGEVQPRAVPLMFSFGSYALITHDNLNFSFVEEDGGVKIICDLQYSWHSSIPAEFMEDTKKILVGIFNDWQEDYASLDLVICMKLFIDKYQELVEEINLNITNSFLSCGSQESLEDTLNEILFRGAYPTLKGNEATFYFKHSTDVKILTDEQLTKLAKCNIILSEIQKRLQGRFVPNCIYSPD